MRFTFTCHVAHHPSGRVTVTPIDFPELAVHATSVDKATEELTLCFDDRIARAHPRRLVEMLRWAAGESMMLSVPGVVVRRSDPKNNVLQPILVLSRRAPAHKPFTEVRAPRLDGRVWLRGKDVKAEAEAAFAAVLEPLGEEARLDLRPDGPELWLELTVEVKPLALSDLRPSELFLDERPLEPPVRSGDGDEADEPPDEWDEKRRKKRPATAPKKKSRATTPTLARIGVPWHTLAANGELEPAYEREELVASLRARLEVEDPEPIVLVGPSGVGKTAILTELARRLAEVERKKPEKERDPRPIYLADGSRLIAGEGFFGDWQKQVYDVAREARAAHAVVIVDHVVHLLEAGKSAHSDQNVADVFAPVLAARELVLIGEASDEEWAEVERRNAALARTFSVIRVDDPGDAETGRILARTAQALGTEHGLRVEPTAVALCQALARRFMPYGALVGNACALLRRLVLRRAHALATRVEQADALSQMSLESGIPQRLLDDREPLDEEDVRAFLRERVKGQAEAVDRVAQVVSVIKANLADRRRPSAVLLFSGPTGVGKTELAKSLAELLFGARDRMIRLDMGEYAGPDALGRLLGDGGLVSLARPRPFAVILLDEIEKAHPAVFDALLGVLGEGRLTDARGRSADLRGAVFIMTSNLGADTWRGRTGFGSGGETASLLQHYKSEAQKFFRPELWNRLDDLIVFRPLGAPEVRAIVDRELVRIEAREGLRRRDVTLEVDDAARDALAKHGFDPRYGARPLKRALERELVLPVATYLAAHPATGPIQLTMGGGLELAAESLPRDEASRVHIERVLERASALRSEVRRWARSSPMRTRVQEIALFERQSRMPTFWNDRKLADERSKATADGRELLATFQNLEGRVEAAEDLAFEAYFGRQAVALLDEDLDAVAAELVGLRERVYALLFANLRTVRLIYVSASTGWPHLCDLYRRVRVWAERKGLKHRGWRLFESREPTPPVGGQKRKKKGEVGYHWQDGFPEPGTPCVAAILNVYDDPSCALLAAEGGIHTVVRGNHTWQVRVAFEATNLALGATPMTPAAIEAITSKLEIRREWLDKGVIEDLRLRRRFEMRHAAVIDEIHTAWQTFRVFS